MSGIDSFAKSPENSTNDLITQVSSTPVSEKILKFIRQTIFSI